MSSDGVSVGTIVGIHRDPTTNAAKWAVIEPGETGQLRFVPLQQAIPRRDGLHLPYAAALVISAPAVLDHTRMSLDEETRLIDHYRLGGASARSARTDVDRNHGAWMVRAEERLAITALEWRPYTRVRIRKVVRTEEVTRVLVLRREELLLEDEPVGSVERLEVAFGIIPPEEHEEIEMVLHREEIVLETRVIPYERVRVRTVDVVAPWAIEEDLRSDHIDIVGAPLGPSPQA